MGRPMSVLRNLSSVLMFACDPVGTQRAVGSSRGEGGRGGVLVQTGCSKTKKGRGLTPAFSHRCR